MAGEETGDWGLVFLLQEEGGWVQEGGGWGVGLGRGGGAGDDAIVRRGGWVLVVNMLQKQDMVGCGGGSTGQVLLLLQRKMNCKLNFKIIELNLISEEFV